MNHPPQGRQTRRTHSRRNRDNPPKEVSLTTAKRPRTTAPTAEDDYELPEQMILMKKNREYNVNVQRPRLHDFSQGTPIDVVGIIPFNCESQTTSSHAPQKTPLILKSIHPHSSVAHIRKIWNGCLNGKLKCTFSCGWGYGCDVCTLVKLNTHNLQYAESTLPLRRQNHLVPTHNQILRSCSGDAAPSELIPYSSSCNGNYER